ncbi:DNA gyrase subunit B [Kitasatospora sp. NPDC059408]|uniref:DNA gyrase subunit B n=1 Tax=Kitasatospora sp. NPDC059408 TaxID=3346823 RepID=UPI00367BC018
MSDDASGYNAASIKVLEWPEAVRRRPGMYVGSTCERGLHQLVYEVLDRPVGEVLAGLARRIDVTLTADGGVRVSDDGPGLAVESGEGGGGAGGGGDGRVPGLEVELTRVGSWVVPGVRPFMGAGLFGTGLAVVNALSGRLTAEVRREGVLWRQEYACGVALAPPSPVGRAAGSGTTIAFWPDAGIFGPARCSFDDLAGHFTQLAFLNAGLDLTLTDGRDPSAPRSLRAHFPGGVRDFVAFLDEGTAPVHPEVIAFEREDPRMAGSVEVALRWSASREERVRGFANSRSTAGGGTHVEGFRDGVAAAVTAYARRRGLRAVAGPGLGADRVCAGLTAVVSVKLDHPEFEGSVRDVLGNAAVRACVEEAVREHLGAWLEAHPGPAAAIGERAFGGRRADDEASA